MKKLNVIVAVVLALALTACGGKKEAAPVSGLNNNGDSPNVQVDAYINNSPVHAFFNKGIVCHTYVNSISCVRVN